MKKTFIVGAASLAFAALPVVGAFASDPAAVVDTLTVTVDESCTFDHDGSSGSYTKSMTAGQLDPNFAPVRLRQPVTMVRVILLVQHLLA